MIATRGSHSHARRRVPLRRIAAAVLAPLALQSAHAFKIDTGNDDVSLNFTNTLRYNLGVRAQGREGAIADWPISAAGDHLYDKGDLVTNRIDLLSELSLSYQKKFGFKVSGASWYDQAYDRADPRTNPNPGYINPYSNGFSNYTKRYYAGPSGELLDAFVFANLSAGDTPIYLRVGRHTNVYGEGLFTIFNSIAYSQMPVDGRKGAATPGAEVKELYLPINNVSVSSQLSDEWSVGGQYFLEWKPTRFPEGGTYFSTYDGNFYGPDVFPLGPSFAGGKGPAIKPGNSGNFGLYARWSPEWLNATMGFYYRKFDDKIPSLVNNAFTTLQTNYGRDIQLVGVSLAKSWAGVSWGSELSYRKNSVLNSNPFVAPAFGREPARGDTLHGLVNGVALFSGGDLFSSATVSGELSFAHLVKVRKNADLYKGVDNAAMCPSQDKLTDGCSTRNFVALNVNFTPVWSQVWPSVDVSLPLTFSRDLYGVSPNNFGGSQGATTYSIGVAFDVKQSYNIALAYTGYASKKSTTFDSTLNRQVIRSANGALSDDRGWVSLTVKASF